jgi:hypothetical protein
MLIGRLVLVPAFLLTLAACSSMGAKSSASMHDDSHGKQDASSKKDDDDAGDKVAKKEFELECARLELNIKKLGNEAEEKSAMQEVADAERGLRDAREALEDFQKHDQPAKLDDSQLDLDQAVQMRVQRQQELDELMAMYKQEELATLTKELVVSRETKTLDFARRRLELQTKATEHLRAIELPKKQRELTEGVAKAERRLADARSKSDKQKLENQLEMMKAEHGIADLEKEVAKMKKKESAA